MKKIFILFLCFCAYLNVYADSNSSGYSFMQNKGQILDTNNNSHPEIIFTGRGDNYLIYLRNNGWSYILKSFDSTSYKTERVDIDFVNPNYVFEFETKNQMPGYDNFPVRNNESINYVLSFGEVVYKNIFNGIDLRFYYDRGNLRYDYIVHPGADPKQIKMEIKHSGLPELNDGYGINIPIKLGYIKKEKPFSYQIENHIRKEVSSKYVLNTNILGFELGNYDISKELIIDPVSLISGKLKHLKSYFQNPDEDFVQSFYSYALSYHNIKRFKDNSVLIISNYADDKKFIDEGYDSAKNEPWGGIRYAYLPSVITKYDSANNKLWSVYHYEKLNNIISWDADDSIIVILAHSYKYFDTLSSSYTKNTVFASIYNHYGELLNRFELVKPDSNTELIIPYQDDDWTMFPHAFKFDNYECGRSWTQPLSYEKSVKILDNKISFLIIGSSRKNNDIYYNASLFFQRYAPDGKLEFTKEIRNNKIIVRENKVVFEESNFGYWWITSDIPTVRFLDDGCFFIIRNNMRDHTKYVSPQYDIFTEFYNKDAELLLVSEKDNDLVYFLQSKGHLGGYQKDFYYNNSVAFTFDGDKNIYSMVILDDSTVYNSKYKNLIIKNPYSNDILNVHPYLFKFDSTLNLKWITQLINYDRNLSIGGLKAGDVPFTGDPLGYHEHINAQKETYTKWNTGSSGVFAIDSTGNIYLPLLLDSTNYDGYIWKQTGARKLTVTKISPEGKILWQDKDVMYFGFDYKKDYFLGSQLLIKNADIKNGTLYLDYYCSNAHTIIPRKDAAKFDFNEFPPVPDLYTLKIVGCEYPYDKLYDILFLKFNINESDLVEAVPITSTITDTVCIGSTAPITIALTNRWHSAMNFEAPLIEGEDFYSLPSDKFTLNAGETKEITILFTPKTLKKYTGKVTFRQNNVGDFSHTVNFTGLTKSTNLQSGLIWDLGTVLINNTSSKTFRLYNNGNIGGWVVGIKNLPAEFKQIMPEQISNFIKGGDSLDYNLEFTPIEAGLFEYKYKLISSSGCPDTLEVTIRGKGVNESIIINADSIDFDYLYHCEEKTDTIKIENVTNSPITYNSSVITGLNADNFTILEKPADGTILLTGEPAKFAVRYKPQLPYGFKQAVLEINTSEKNIKCPLKGEYAKNEITANDIDLGFRNINVTYDTTVVIKNNSKDLIQLGFALPSDNRIIITSSLPLEIPSMGEKELALEIKSATTEPVNSKLMLVFSDRCTTDIETNIICNFDSAKVQISGIDFGKVPYCEDRTDSIVISNTGIVNVKLINLEFLENDGRFEFVNNDIYPEEISAVSTYSKLIRYISGKKEKSVNTAKVVITLEIDGVEKSFEIQISGERIIPELEYLNLIEFGELKPGEVKNTAFEISNTGEEIEIKNIQIKNPDFRVVNFDKMIQGKSKGKINLSFSSALIGVYDTEMTVYYSLGECKDSLKIPLKSEVKRLMTIWANHDTVDAGTTGYYVPVYAKTDKEANINGMIYTLNIKYLREFYNPVTSDDAQILSKTKDGLFEQITVSGTFPVFSDSTAILFSLKGDILFTLNKTTPIEIEYLTSVASLDVTTNDGSLALNPMCIEQLRTIKSLIPTRLQVAPNPADGDLKVTIGTQEEGSFSIIIYDFQGREVAKQIFFRNSKTYEENELTFNLKEFSAGVYSVHLTAPWTILKEQLVIEK